jgi:glycosyltransferase involved in cell wall biosynthesis
MNILVVYEPRGAGIKYHRQEVPYVKLQQLYPEFKVKAVDTATTLTEDILKDFQIVHFQKQVSLFQPIGDVIAICKKLNILTILDIDDYWSPPVYMPMHSVFKAFGLTKKIIDSVRAVDLVITPCDDLLSDLKELNDNVEFIPNAVDPDSAQFKSESKPSEFVRIGYITGISHLRDSMMLGESIKKLDADKELKNLFQIVLGGFDTRETYVNINGQAIETPLNRQVYVNMEKVLTNNYRTCLGYKEYVNMLRAYKPLVDTDIFPYRRLWATDTNNYAKMYDEIDISLAPLEDNKFNRSKSNLKVIEAGFKKKCLVASDVMPYTMDCDETNSVLVENKYEWYREIKKLILNPSRVKELGEALYETVRNDFHINTVTKARAELYKANLDNKNK